MAMRTRITEMNLMHGFTDLHTHILPGVDDGAQNMKQACELVRLAWANGTRTLFLTPHYRGAYKKNPPGALRETFAAFRQAIREEFPDMRLYLGCEIHYESEAPGKLAEGEILSLNDSEYALLEFSEASLRSRMITGVNEILRHGFTPIIAHAERYQVFRDDASLVDEVLDMGALIQLNADSVMGAHGFRTKRFCHRLLKAGKVHFIASDAHDANIRPPLLRDCYLRVQKKYGTEYAAQIFFHNAEAVIETET